MLCFDFASLELSEREEDRPENCGDSLSAAFKSQESGLGLLIFVFYFTSKNLLYYQHLLVNMEQSSKKDLDYEQVQIS